MNSSRLKRVGRRLSAPVLRRSSEILQPFNELPVAGGGDLCDDGDSMSLTLET